MSKTEHSNLSDFNLIYDKVGTKEKCATMAFH